MWRGWGRKVGEQRGAGLISLDRDGRGNQTLPRVVSQFENSCPVSPTAPRTEGGRYARTIPLSPPYEGGSAAAQGDCCDRRVFREERIAK